jgi:hypothetical protein
VLSSIIMSAVGAHECGWVVVLRLFWMPRTIPLSGQRAAWAAQQRDSFFKAQRANLSAQVRQCSQRHAVSSSAGGEQQSVVAPRTARERLAHPADPSITNLADALALL